jgi:hypothetical protein
MTVTLAKWTIDEYHSMIEAGLLDNRQVELLQGEIVEMPPEGEADAYFSSEAEEHLRTLLGDRFSLILSSLQFSMPTILIVAAPPASPKLEKFSMKFKHLGVLFRWGIILATLIVVGKTCSDNWQEVKNLQIQEDAWIYLGFALVISLLSHCLSGILWGEIIKNFNYPVSWRWAMATFLTTELAKYLPGDVWQVYGRLKSARKLGVPLEVGIVSVILQSVYISAAGLGFGLLASKDPLSTVLCSIGLVGIAVCVHPYVFAKLANLIEQLIDWKILHLFKLKQWQKPQMKSYPLLAIAGQFLFLALRSISFLLVVLSFSPIATEAIVPIAAGFGFAWALGIVSPISGGVGVFEATAIVLVDNAIGSSYSLGAIVLYRLIALMTEVFGAGLGFLFKVNTSHT